VSVTPEASTGPSARRESAARDRRSRRRKEDLRLLTGAARFVDDLDRPGMLHATILRSPHGHARITGIDAESARARSEVVAVVTAGDIPEMPLIPMRMFKREGMERFLQPPLATGVVRYSGEPVAVVLAGSRYAAEDAAELIEVAYEPLDPVLDAEAAIEAGAPVLHESAGSNMAAEFAVDHGDAAAAFAEADHVVAATIRCQRHGAVPMETRGLLAEVDPASGVLTVWGASKIVHVNQGILATLLGWPRDRVRLVELDVGGGFGARGEFYPEDYLVPWCAVKTGRPVGWTEDREEHLRSCNHSREQTHHIELALTGDGRFLALRDRVVQNTGAYVRTHGTVVPGMTAGLLQGPYRFEAFECQVQHVVTNKTPAGTYRAPGRYEATLARERVIDMAARELGLDPLELRRRNLIQPDAMPYDTGAHTDGHPVIYDSGDYPLLVEKGTDAFDLAGLREWRERQAGDVRRGVGVALFVEKSGIANWEYARVGLTREGAVAVHSGSASVGQGVETVLAQICADHFGCDYEAVLVRHGDTTEVPYGMGAFGSRATALGGSAVMRAAVALRERVLDLAADRLEARKEDLEVAGSSVGVRGAPGSRLSFAELAAMSEPLSALPRGERPGLEEEAFFHAGDMSFPYGLHVAAVEADVRTGQVRIHRYGVAYDIGHAVNPMLVHGQIVGGVAQGIGGALYEEFAYDDAGQLISGSFMDYLVPTAGEAPEVDVLVTEDAPSPLTPLGVKGAGEGGTTAAGAAIANAVSDALGAEVERLPITPESVCRLARAEARP
jgi:aerobic carbon-monoxide dehydrogenase large subunit